MTNKSRGFTLIEVLIALSISAVVVLSGSAVMDLLLALQNQYKAKGALAAFNFILQNQFNDRQLWLDTLANPTNITGQANDAAAPVVDEPNMQCLLNNSNCALVGATGLFYPFDLGRQSALTDNPQAPVFHAFSNIALAAGSKLGFTVDGQRCATYSAAGNDACPISYDLRWRPICPAAGTCLRPQVEIQVRWSYNTSGTGRFRMPLNVATYGLNIYRKESIERNEELLVVYESAGTEGPCNTSPTFGSHTKRLFSRIVLDEGGNVQLPAAAPRDYILLRRGNYQCQVRAPAYGVGQTKIYLESEDPAQYLQTGNVTRIFGDEIQVPRGTSGILTVDATLELNGGGVASHIGVRVKQVCEKSNSDNIPAESSNLDLGRKGPNAFYSTPADPSVNVFTTFRCVRTE